MRDLIGEALFNVAVAMAGMVVGLALYGIGYGFGAAHNVDRMFVLTLVCGWLAVLAITCCIFASPRFTWPETWRQIVWTVVTAIGVGVAIAGWFR